MGCLACWQVSNKSSCLFYIQELTRTFCMQPHIVPLSCSPFPQLYCVMQRAAQSLYCSEPAQVPLPTWADSWVSRMYHNTHLWLLRSRLVLHLSMHWPSGAGGVLGWGGRGQTEEGTEVGRGNFKAGVGSQGTDWAQGGDGTSLHDAGWFPTLVPIPCCVTQVAWICMHKFQSTDLSSPIGLPTAQGKETTIPLLGVATWASPSLH